MGEGKVFLMYTSKTGNSTRIYYINILWALFCWFFKDVGQHFSSEKFYVKFYFMTFLVHIVDRRGE